MNRVASAGLLALLLVAVSHAGALAQSNSSGRSSQWTAAQKKKVARLDTAAKNCIAQQSLDHPGVLEAYRADNLRPVTDGVWSQCQTEMDHLSREYAYLHGFGTGWVFVDGPYRNEVPRVVKGFIKDEIERRLAVIAAAEENSKALAGLLYQCTESQLHHLVSSAERAELLAAAAMTNCSRQIAAAIHAIIEALRAKSRIDEAEIGNLRLHARNNFHAQVLARAVQMRADGGRAASPARPAPPAQSAPKPPETAGRKSVSSGTGFVVSEQGHVLTNAHVVEGCTAPKAFTSSGSMFAGRVLAKDEKNDLAVIATALRPTIVPRFRTAVKLGESVSVFGYPYADLLSSLGTFSAGNVTAVTGVRDDIRLLQISAPVQPGNSGGPLLDEAGNVVGVVVARLATTEERIPQNINFAIRAAIATAFLEANSIDFETGERGSAHPPVEIAEQARRISVRIQCDFETRANAMDTDH